MKERGIWTYSKRRGLIGEKLFNRNNEEENEKGKISEKKKEKVIWRSQAKITHIFVS